jgi:GH24 family phage-related lysozyme (muramidase)
MTPAAREAFLAKTRELEGVCQWLYLDVRGLVTVGIGNLVDPIGSLWAANLDWRSGDEPAADSEIWAAWRTVKGHQELRTHGGGAFQGLTAIRATDESIDRLVELTMTRFERELRRFFPEMPGWPDSAWVSVMLMAWALGASFPSRWPKLTAALRTLDFGTAALECSMSDAGQNASFKERNRLVREGFLAAAATIAAP